MTLDRGEITVHFGDEFIRQPGSDHRRVVIDMDSGSKNEVGAATVGENENGRETLGLSGSTEAKDIHKITDRWTVDRVIAATRAYFGGEDLRREQLLVEESEKPPKVLRHRHLR